MEARKSKCQQNSKNRLSPMSEGGEPDLLRSPMSEGGEP